MQIKNKLRLTLKKLFNSFNTRLGLVCWSTFFIWVKTMIAYFSVFKGLNSSKLADYLLVIVNPIGFTAIFFSLVLFVKRKQLFYLGLLLMNLIGNLLVYGNVLYYREFSDFLTLNTLTGGAGMVGKGFDLGAIAVSWVDLVFWIDLVLILILFLTKKIKMDERRPTTLYAFKIFSVSVMIFGLNFWMADLTEHRLVSRQAQYDATYIVRYLGLGPWLATNSWYTHVSNETRAMASKTDFTKVQNYIQEERYLAPNDEMFGIAKNRNVIVIHLESLQQDVINMKVNGEEVTPFLNSLYNNNPSVYSFSNFFNQVGQGKTSDAETMLETSTFGLASGSLFSSLGSTQTFQAMPAILQQKEGYSSAVFHGNVGSFYSRNNVYRNMGYQNFFDQSFFNLTPDNSTAWGVKDKYFFKDSIPYLEQLQQPFYVKYLTVTNHTPYTGLKDFEINPKLLEGGSGNSVVDNYFVTANYLDSSVKDFFDYLKKSGLYEKSIIVLYGDHYGISGSDTKYYAPFIGKNAEDWTEYDNTMMQRTPFMIDIPGQTTGHISDEYIGEIDVMPTLEHLLGISTKDYIQFGQDAFAPNREQFVALRNRGFVTPTITKSSATSSVYHDTKTGEVLTLTEQQQKYVDSIQEKVNQMLDMSDTFNTEDLLRFYTPPGFEPVQPGSFSYGVNSTRERLRKEQDVLKARSTSLLSENQGVSSVNLFNDPVLAAQKAQEEAEAVKNAEKNGTNRTSSTAKKVEKGK
ncbi:LTA synthase family protein [Lactococcus muris]|uniref:LTA synthase family protein n=1 Tax=Lactococcus muris TaxID=2941330 RepID=A0ABV4DAL6_9LACT